MFHCFRFSEEVEKTMPVGVLRAFGSAREVQWSIKFGDKDAEVLRSLVTRIRFPGRGDVLAVWERAFVDTAVALLTVNLGRGTIVLRQLRSVRREAAEGVLQPYYPEPDWLLRAFVSNALLDIGIDRFPATYGLTDRVLKAVMDGFVARVNELCQQAEQEEAALPLAA